MVTTAQPQQAASAAGLNNLHTDAVISNQYLSNQANHHAAVIQKHWRGYQVRKSLQHLHLDAAHSQERATAAATAQLLATRQAGAQNAEYPEIWRPSTGTVVRSRGCLQAALSHRYGTPHATTRCLKGGTTLTTVVPGMQWLVQCLFRLGACQQNAGASLLI